MVLVGIVLYNPDIMRLDENISSIINQVEQIILVDNGSTNIEAIEQLLKKYPMILIRKNEKNLGIAKALNQIMEFANEAHFEWVLTLDQDSVSKKDIIKQYSLFLGEEKIGILTCHIKDRNFDFESNALSNSARFQDVEFCITSGSLMRTKAWKNIGGYDELLFIDKVDTDICWSLIEHGWRIVKIPYYGLLHEIGNKTRRIKIFGQEIVIFNHSPMRCYYIVRNGIYCAKKHKKYRNTSGMCRSSYHRILLCLLFEDGKMEKLCAGIRGLKDGYVMTQSLK